MAANRIQLGKSLTIQVHSVKWREVLRFPKLADTSPQVDIFLAHDLRNKGRDLQDRLERYVSGICSSAASATKVSCRLHSYQVDPESLQRKRGFDMEYAGFIESIDTILAKSMMSALPSPLPPSRVVFVAFELGVWMVKNFLYNESSDSSQHDPTSFLGRLTGSIFLGPAEDFEHRSDYVKERLNRVLTSERISESVSPRRFARVNESFSAMLADEENVVTKTTWIVSAPDVGSSTPIAPPLDNRGADGMKRSKPVTLLGRLDPRNRHASTPAESEQSLRDKARDFCTRLHALAAGQNLSEDFNPDDNLYVARAKPLIRSRKNSISNSTCDLSEPPSPLYHREPVIVSVPNNALSASASHLTSGLLRLPATSSARARSPPRLSIESPQPYLHPGIGNFPFGSGHDLGPRMLTPEIPASLERPRSDYFPLPRPDSAGSRSAPASPASRSKRREKSLSSKQKGAKFDSEDKIRAVHERISDYYRAALRTSDELDFYTECLSLLPKRDPISALYCRIQARVTVLLLNEDAYVNAKQTLDRLVDRLVGAIDAKLQDKDRPEDEDKNLQELEDVLPEVLYYRSVARIRLGEYEEAYDDLSRVEQQDWFHLIDDILASSDMIEPGMRNDPRAEVVVNTNRVVALLWGYFGRFESANERIEKAGRQCSNFLSDGREDMQDLAPGQLPVDAQMMKANMDLTRARLKMVQGHGNEARQLLGPALDRLESRFPRGHVLALEAASLNACILASISDKTAEAACVATYQATKQYLGERHPLSREVLGTLADIFAAKSRPYEALDTVHHLWSNPGKGLAPGHPQVMSYRFRVGEANLSIGNYAIARRMLQGLCRAARENQEEQPHQRLGQRPEMLRYRAKLALANCRLGKTDEAEQGAKKCLRKQLDIFGPKTRGAGDDIGLRQLLQALVEDRIACARAPPHPDVLGTLVVCAAILEKQDPGGEVRDEVLDLVCKARVIRHGERHHLTLSTRLEVAFNRLENGVSGAEEAEKLASLFEGVAQDCENTLGTNHILTLRAGLGRLFATVNISTGPSLFRREASENLASQVDLMGKCHPMVMDSKWRLFVFEALVFGDDDAHEAGAQLLASLRLEELRRERLMESLYLEEKVARIYGMQLYDYERSLLIFTDMLEYCLRTHEVGFDEELENFCWEACDLIRETVDLAVGMLEDKHDAVGNKSDAASQAMHTFLNLVDDLSRSIDNIQSCVEGVVLLSRHLQQVAYIEENDPPERLSDKMKSAFLDWRQPKEPEAPGLGIENGPVIYGPQRGKASKRKSKGKGKGERRNRARRSDYDMSSGWLGEDGGRE